MNLTFGKLVPSPGLIISCIIEHTPPKTKESYISVDNPNQD